MRKGFTFIEIMIVMVVTMTLLTLATISLISLQQHTLTDTSLEKLLSDIKFQQIQAMNGAGSAQKFGIHFDTSAYTLFSGDTYLVSDPSNFVVTLDGGITISSVTFPQSEIIFEKGSGEVEGFIEGSNTVSLYDSSGGGTVIVTLNKLGVVTQIQ